MHFFFYLFSILILSSAIAAVLSIDTVHSVLYLIVAFLSAGGLFISINAEFIAMVLIIVYVGAIAVLFLFIVMMLPINEMQKKQSIVKFSILPSALICGFLFFWLINAWEIVPRVLIFRQPITVNYLGSILYTKYIYVFQLAGVILLFSMIGSISLTLHKSKKIKRQNARKQVKRYSKALLVDVENKKGVEL